MSLTDSLCWAAPYLSLGSLFNLRKQPEALRIGRLRIGILTNMFPCKKYKKGQEKATESYFWGLYHGTTAVICEHLICITPLVLFPINLLFPTNVFQEALLLIPRKNLLPFVPPFLLKILMHWVVSFFG